MGSVSPAKAQDPAPADTVASQGTSNDQEGDWLSRVLRRFFGNNRQPGEELNGRAVELVDSYAAHIGKPIAVVIVHQVERFENYWDEDQGSSQQFLNSLTKPFHSYTKDSMIREYLLFEQGQPLDPFLLADSERMLRQLDFINDARIIIVPLMGEDESVAVVVETRDKWPFGITGSLKDVNRYVLNLYFTNISGQGIRLDNIANYRGDMEPNLGYEGKLAKRNVRGSFIDLRLLYEDTWRQLSRQVEAERTLIHPGIRWVGGAGWEYTDVRDNGGVPRKYQLGDYWLGRATPLSLAPSTTQSARPMLIPALRYRKIDFQVRPEASADSNSRYLNTRDYLAGLTFQRIKHYKTSFLFKMGETEDVPAGYTAKLSGGYQDREVYGRTSAFLQTAYTSVRNRGDIILGLVDLGGYFHNRALEDGALNVGASYFSRLKGKGDYRLRLYGILTYTLAFNRNGEGALNLGNSTRIRGMEDSRVLGNQRMILNLESRLFTPWSLMGFRFMVFGYADTGTVGDDKDPILQQKFYSSVGLGLRINNPDLVLPSTQVRFSIVNSIEGKQFNLGFRIGGVDYLTIEMPGTRPGGFEIR
jgi:hypothetical protein